MRKQLVRLGARTRSSRPRRTRRHKRARDDTRRHKRPPIAMQHRMNAARSTAIHRENLLYWAIQRTYCVPRPLRCNAAMQRNAAQCSAMQRNAAQCSMQPYITIQYTTQYTPPLMGTHLRARGRRQPQHWMGSVCDEVREGLSKRAQIFSDCSACGGRGGGRGDRRGWGRT